MPPSDILGVERRRRWQDDEKLGILEPQVRQFGADFEDGGGAALSNINELGWPLGCFP